MAVLAKVWLMGAMVCVGLLGCAQKEVAKRNPASEGPLKLFESFDLQLAKDFAHFESHGKKLRIAAKSRFWTDIDKDYLKDNGKKALDEAVAEALKARPGENGSFPARLKSHLIDEVVSHFVKTLRVHKIVDGTIQFDIYLLPELDSPTDFSNELSSNRLVRLGDLGNLAASLKKAERWTVTRQLAEVAPSLLQANQSIFGNQPRYVYAGGVISVYLKLLDTHFKFLKLPNPKKNAVKGFVRYRRYFIHDGSLRNGGSCRGRSLNVTKAFWAKGGRTESQFMTVDLYKGFNLAGFIPQPTTLEVFPGRWVATNKGHSDLLPKGHDFVGKTLRTGGLTLLAETTRDSEKLNYSYRLNSLVYNFETRRFDSSLSSLSGDVTTSTPMTEESTFNPFLEEKAGAQNLLEGCQEYLMETLDLERVASHVKEGGRP